MPGTAGVREDRHARSPRHRLVRQQRRDVEQLLEPFRPDHAGLAEERVDDRVAGCERPGMRGGGA